VDTMDQNVVHKVLVNKLINGILNVNKKFSEKKFTNINSYIK